MLNHHLSVQSEQARLTTRISKKRYLHANSLLVSIFLATKLPLPPRKCFSSRSNRFDGVHLVVREPCPSEVVHQLSNQSYFVRLNDGSTAPRQARCPHSRIRNYSPMDDNNTNEPSHHLVLFFLDYYPILECLKGIAVKIRPYKQASRSPSAYKTMKIQRKHNDM